MHRNHEEQVGSVGLRMRLTSFSVIIIIIISKSYIARVSTNKVLKALSIYKFSERQVIAVMNSETQLCSTLKDLQGATAHTVDYLLTWS